MSDPRSSGDSAAPRRLLAAGIGLAALCLVGVAVWLRSPAAPPESSGPVARTVSEIQREHEKGLAENEAFDRYLRKPRTDAEFREEVRKSETLTAEQKRVLLESQAKLVEIEERSEAEHKAFTEELERDRLRSLARLQAKQEERDKEKNKLKLVFSVEAAAGPYLPCQPIPVRFTLSNQGEDPIRLFCSLEPRYGDIQAEAAPAGSPDFHPLFLGTMVERPVLLEANAPVLAPGGTMTWQADLSPFLGYDAVANSAAAVSQTLRISLKTGLAAGVLKAGDLSIALAPATGDDQAILVRLLRENLLPFLGTGAMKTSSQRFEGDVSAALTALRSLIDRYPDAKYTRDLRAGFVTLISANWISLRKVQSKEVLVAQARAVADEYWRRDLPETWSHAETLLPLARLSNWIGDAAREKDALNRFVQLCPDDPRAEAARQTLQRR